MTWMGCGKQLRVQPYLQQADSYVINKQITKQRNILKKGLRYRLINKERKELRPEPEVNPSPTSEQLSPPESEP